MTTTRTRRRPAWGRVFLRTWQGIFALAGLAAVAAHVWLGYAVSTVLSGSMAPTFDTGDVVITKLVPAGTLRVGDVPVYIPAGQTEPVAHRITAVEETPGGGHTLHTKGDANPAADNWRSVVDDDVEVPVVVASLPTHSLKLASVTSTATWGMVTSAVGLTLLGSAVSALIGSRRPRRERPTNGRSGRHRPSRRSRPASSYLTTPVVNTPVSSVRGATRG